MLTKKAKKKKKKKNIKRGDYSLLQGEKVKVSKAKIGRLTWQFKKKKLKKG